MTLSEQVISTRDRRKYTLEWLGEDLWFDFDGAQRALRDASYDRVKTSPENVLRRFAHFLRVRRPDGKPISRSCTDCGKPNSSGVISLPHAQALYRRVLIWDRRPDGKIAEFQSGIAKRVKIDGTVYSLHFPRTYYLAFEQNAYRLRCRP